MLSFIGAIVIVGLILFGVWFLVNNVKLSTKTEEKDDTDA